MPSGRSLKPYRALVTGAAGAVGTELVARLRQLGVDVTPTSRSGSVGVVAWDLAAPPPASLDRHWDLVVHAAASTRWSMTTEEAVEANVRTTEGLLAAIGDSPLIHLSTAHVVGKLGSVDSDDEADYRNSYEWSKAACERMLRDRPSTTIVRFPIVFGRRSDGQLARYSGLFKLIAAVASGVVPAVVGREAAPFDVISVDDVVETILRLIETSTEDRPDLVLIGCGDEGPTVSETIDLTVRALNEWRADAGVPPIEPPPILKPERWHRFFLPFATEHFSPLQLRTIEVFTEFEPYLSLENGFETHTVVADSRPVITKTVKAWAAAHPHQATRQQRKWS